MHMAKVIKSYLTDIDAREFKEFDDELDVDIIKRKGRFDYSDLNNSRQILFIISVRICHFHVNKDIFCHVSFLLHIYFISIQD